MNKHTPGPWKLFFETDGHESRVEGVQATISDFGIICYLGTGISNDRAAQPEIEKANGLLIAAAPELLEALDVCLGHLTGGMDGNWADVDAPEIARTAIAKARGEA